MSYYNKALAAFLGAVSTWGMTAWQNDQQITGDEWFGVLGVLGTVIAVYAVRNQPEPG
jgi:hypothetical protein